MFMSHDDFWRRFAGEVGHPEWVSDARFATMEARRENRELVLRALGEALAADVTERWVERLAPLGVVVAPVETLEKALASEQARARGMVVDIATPHGTIRAVGNPVKISGVQDEFFAPPLLGEHGLIKETVS